MEGRRGDKAVKRSREGERERERKSEEGGGERVSGMKAGGSRLGWSDGSNGVVEEDGRWMGARA